MTGHRGFNLVESARFVEREWPKFAAFMNDPARPRAIRSGSFAWGLRPNGTMGPLDGESKGITSPPGDSLDHLWGNLRGPLNQLAGYPFGWHSGDPLAFAREEVASVSDEKWQEVYGQAKPKTLGHPPYPRRRPFTMIVPAGFFVCSAEGVEWRASVGNETVVYRQDWTFGQPSPGAPKWVDLKARDRLSEHWTLLLALAWEPTIRRRVRVCAGCHKFFLLTRARKDSKERAVTCRKRCAARWMASPINRERIVKRKRDRRRRRAV